MQWRLLTCTTVMVLLLHSPSILHAAEADNLGQLTLDKVSKLFTANNRELLLSKRYLEGTKADTLTAAQNPNPTFSLNSNNFNLQGSNGNGGLSNRTLDTIARIEQPVERGNKRALRMAMADDAVQASELDLRDSLRQQKQLLYNAYYDLLLAQETEHILQENQALYDKMLQAAELRLKAGDISTTDTSRIRIDVLRAQNDLRQAKAEKEKAQADLAYMIGKEQEAKNIMVSDTWPDTAMAAENLSANVEQRPDIQAAIARIQLANENRKLAQAQTTRDITIGMQYEHYPSGNGGGGGNNNGRNTIGVGFSIPLFTGYQYQGEIAHAEVDYTTAMEAEERIRANALSEVNRARADLDASIEKVNRYDQNMLQEAEKTAQAAEFAYQHGAMGVTDLLDARRVLRALQIDAATAHADFAKSLANWRAAINPGDN
ncbi:TolC family protein [Methylobacillus caricis]|uniref:TolC family protein n=1 Tax=Methylobacillus caricis TaxID=1971611 RepID=UPI001CFFD3B6|nr:TolC family protein [Methylobacillus caricis]MCB5187811.1 TolC family protein [Methylobacillus caricis]